MLFKICKKDMKKFFFITQRVFTASAQTAIQSKKLRHEFDKKKSSKVKTTNNLKTNVEISTTIKNTLKKSTNSVIKKNTSFLGNISGYVISVGDGIVYAKGLDKIEKIKLIKNIFKNVIMNFIYFFFFPLLIIFLFVYYFFEYFNFLYLNWFLTRESYISMFMDPFAIESFDEMQKERNEPLKYNKDIMEDLSGVRAEELRRQQDVKIIRKPKDIKSQNELSLCCLRRYTLALTYLGILSDSQQKLYDPDFDIKEMLRGVLDGGNRTRPRDYTKFVELRKEQILEQKLQLLAQINFLHDRIVYSGLLLDIILAKKKLSPEVVTQESLKSLQDSLMQTKSASTPSSSTDAQDQQRFFWKLYCEFRNSRIKQKEKEQTINSPTSVGRDSEYERFFFDLYQDVKLKNFKQIQNSMLRKGVLIDGIPPLVLENFRNEEQVKELRIASERLQNVKSMEISLNKYDGNEMFNRLASRVEKVFPEFEFNGIEYCRIKPEVLSKSIRDITFQRVRYAHVSNGFGRMLFWSNSHQVEIAELHKNLEQTIRDFFTERDKLFADYTTGVITPMTYIAKIDELAVRIDDSATQTLQHFSSQDNLSKRDLHCLRMMWEGNKFIMANRIYYDMTDIVNTMEQISINN